MARQLITFGRGRVVHPRWRRLDDNLCMRLLQKFGYTVRDAGNAEHSLRLFETEPPHVPLTDLTIPRSDGLTLALHLRALQPELPVVRR